MGKQGHPVKNVCQDNAGENKKLQERSNSKDWKLGIMYKYTRKDTP